MTYLQVEIEWPEATRTITLHHLADACGLGTAELDELVEYGALQPLPTPDADANANANPDPNRATAGNGNTQTSDTQATDDSQPCMRLFSAAFIAPLKVAGRLRRDFDLDLFSVGLLLEYLCRIDMLEHQLLWMQTQGTPRQPDSDAT